MPVDPVQLVLKHIENVERTGITHTRCGDPSSSHTYIVFVTCVRRNENCSLVGTWQVRAPLDTGFQYVRRECTRNQVARATRLEAGPRTEFRSRSELSRTSPPIFANFFRPKFSPLGSAAG